MNRKYCRCCEERTTSLDEMDLCEYFPRPCSSRCRKCAGNEKEEIKYCPSNSNSFNPTFNPSITINMSPGYTPSPIGVETVQYITLAEEGKKVYTNKDALKQYGSSDILDPDNVSTVNLFVNGVLQPPSIYNVKEGVLHLESSDLPPKDAPIILLFVTVKG